MLKSMLDTVNAKTEHDLHSIIDKLLQDANLQHKVLKNIDCN